MKNRFPGPHDVDPFFDMSPEQGQLLKATGGQGELCAKLPGGKGSLQKTKALTNHHQTMYDLHNSNIIVTYSIQSN